jgi:hypothetical protein
MIGAIFGNDVWDKVSNTSRRIAKLASREDFFIWLMMCASLSIGPHGFLGGDTPDWPRLPCYISVEGRGVNWSVIDNHQNVGLRLHRLGAIIQAWKVPMSCSFTFDTHFTANELAHTRFFVYPSLESRFYPILKEMYAEGPNDETVFTLEYLVKKFDDAINVDLHTRWFTG